jgi:UrcA family protein
MTNFTARIAGLATLALAVLPAAALTNGILTSAAHAEAVRVGDLNLASAEGRSNLARRTDRAAAEFCSDRIALAARVSCERTVREEVQNKLAEAGPSRLARAAAAARPSAS